MEGLVISYTRVWYQCNLEIVSVLSVIPVWDRFTNWLDWFSSYPLFFSVEVQKQMLATGIIGPTRVKKATPQLLTGTESVTNYRSFSLFFSIPFTSPVFALASAELQLFGLCHWLKALKIPPILNGCLQSLFMFFLFVDILWAKIKDYLAFDLLLIMHCLISSLVVGHFRINTLYNTLHVVCIYWSSRDFLCSICFLLVF